MRFEAGDYVRVCDPRSFYRNRKARVRTVETFGAIVVVTVDVCGSNVSFALSENNFEIWDEKG